MENLLLKENNDYIKLQSFVAQGKTPVLLTNLPYVARSHFIASLKKEYRNILVVCSDEQILEKINSDIKSFSFEKTNILPSRDLTFYNIENASKGWEHKRLLALSTMQSENCITLTTMPALMLNTIPLNTFKKSSIIIDSSKSYSPETLAKQLIAIGYKRYLQVEGTGQFSLRGGILDIFPPNKEHPVRIEFWGDDIDTMAYFDKDSQRRITPVDIVSCLPNSEILLNDSENLIKSLNTMLDSCNNDDLKAYVQKDIEKLENGISFPLDKYMPYIYPESETAINYIKEKTLIIFCDSDKINTYSKSFEAKTADDISILLERNIIFSNNTNYIKSLEDCYHSLLKFPSIRMDDFKNTIPSLSPKEIIDCSARELYSYNGNLETASSDIEDYRSQGYRVCLLCPNDLRRKNLYALLSDKNLKTRLSNKLPKFGEINIMEGAISCGLEYPNDKLVIFTEGQLQNKKAAKKIKGKGLKSYSDLIVGDIVVHEHHGIGRFIGLEKLVSSDKIQRDYIKIAFAGTDFLYVPATNLDLVSKYIGTDEKFVRMNKLGGTTWQTAKTKAKAAAKDLAAGLIKLYAKRSEEVGFAFPTDDEFQREFENSFEYEETEDQLRSAIEIKKDMQDTKPMDRLLCGDVGFGKTEVALRAVMKCILASKQAAILVPTTVLARQHYLTAISRFKGFPLQIEMLSRYKTEKEEKDILKRLADGRIDLLIGTHKLFKKGIKFKDLGLLVIDEEQRFGVEHKERLKEITENVDVLTLSATPIPRTLNMALSGVRDMSILEEAPAERFPVQSYVMEYDRFTILDALRRELHRGGQSFYLHNNTESIDSVAFKISTEIPQAVVAVAHGKMSQKELAKIMERMSQGEIDILVCTTIIETGIDIPNANTLIVENADRMGLSSLHQLRGRVGRSNRHAFAYFTYSVGKALSEISSKRLRAIREFTEFGSGFKIAMRDLEIRGAGNILGPQQSGHLMSVGYDLYLKILDEAVKEERGEIAIRPIECSIELSVEARISDKYIEEIGSRLDLYKRIASISTDDEMTDVLDEMIDRFGDVPLETHNLCRIALLRNNCSSLGIEEIKMTDGKVIITFINADYAKLSSLCSSSEYKGRLLLSPDTKPYLTIRLKSTENVLVLCENLVMKYSQI